MRLHLLVLLVALAWSSALAVENPAPLHDGQPGCHIRFEFQRLWRNHFVPEQYWECVDWGLPARARKCPPNTLFQDAWQTCVPYTQWEWTPYMNPPTRPCEAHDQCIGLETDGRESAEIEQCPVEAPTVPTTANPTTPIWEVPTTDEGANGEPIESVPFFICPGSTEEQHTPGPMNCVRPECTMEDWMSGRLFPTNDPTLYFKCGPGTGNVFIMQCAPETCFSVQDQVCVHFRKWTNVCNLNGVLPWE